jgi:hypothetical protein
MTVEECKELIVKKIGLIGGIRFDEFAAGYDMHSIQGFSQVFHPHMIKQLIFENKIGEVKYVLLDKPDHVLSFLLPKGTNITLNNL